jgi:fucose permease
MKANANITLLGFVMIGIYGFILAALSPMLPSMSETFHLGITDTGVIFTVNFFGMVAFLILCGMIADRIGKQMLVTVTAGGMAVSLMILGFSPSFPVLLVSMFLCGGFGGSLESMVSALLVDINPHKEASMISFSQVCYGAGALLGPIVAGLAIVYCMRWQWFYFAAASVFGVLFLLMLFIRKKEIALGERLRWRDIKPMFRSPKFLLLCVCMFCTSGAEVGSWGWMSMFLEKAGYQTETSGVAVGVFWAGMTLGRFLFGWLAKKIDERKLVVFLSFFSSVALLMSVFARSGALLWIVIAFMGFGFSAQWPLVLTHGIKMFPNQSGTASAILIGSCGLGIAIVPLIIGALAEKLDILYGIAAPAVFTLAIAFIFLSFKRKKTPLLSSK